MILKSGIEKLKTITSIKKQVGAIYKKYHTLTKAVQTHSRGRLMHFNLKRAVDAIHYLGGGWPSPNSKGRMESACDAIAGMYKTLDFIGQGAMLKEYMRKNHGITINIPKRKKIKDFPITPDVAQFLARKYKIEPPATLSDFVEQVVMICDDLQTDICKLADIVRDDLRPSVQEELGIEDHEYDRLTNIDKLRAGKKSRERIGPKVEKAADSFESFTEVAKELKK